MPKQLTVTHPVTNETVTITSPMPKDLRVALRYLREYRGGGQPVDAAD
jgi:hypothetical protein